MISNRTLIYMTGLVIVSILVLFSLNLNTILSGQVDPQPYLKYNDVKGIAIKHNDKTYTLNFKQQKDVIDILNQSVQVVKIKQGTRQPADFKQLLIYQFEGKADLVITPLTYVDDELVYSIPEWNPDGFMMETSDGHLKKIIAEAYDQ